MTRNCCRCGKELRFTQYTCPNCSHRVQGCKGFACKEPLTIGKPESHSALVSDGMRTWWEKRKEARG